MKYFTLTLCAISVFALSGCVSREQADARLARACAAAAELFIVEGNKIKEIKQRLYGTDKTEGKGYRRVTLKVLETDGWYDAEKEYSCVFAETFAPFKITHQATIYQLRVDGQTYGKQGDKLLGSFEDHMKLMETVEKSLMLP